GAGGAGGVSIGILHNAGSRVNLDAMTTITCGAGGRGGSGAAGGFSGAGAPSGERGVDGSNGMTVPVLSL
ncbi:MAG: hypothetical protein M3O50_15805, partial [Myxococcota bacterium]|nr:hypothetical protein [Myxococcota bacterium]